MLSQCPSELWSSQSSVTPSSAVWGISDGTHLLSQRIP